MAVHLIHSKNVLELRKICMRAYLTNSLTIT